MERNIRKLKTRPLALGERALVTQTGDYDPDVYLVQHHCEIVDLSPNRLKLVTPDLIPAGQYLEIAIRLECSVDECQLSGVVRSVMPCAGGKRYLLDVDVVKDDLAEHWRYQFN